MKPKKIFLIRHGESTENINSDIDKFIPDWKKSLTKKGKEQAQKAGKALFKTIGNSPTVMYTSPWKRTLETAEAIKNYLNISKFYEDPRLREQEWGNFKEDGLSKRIEYERYKFGSFFYRIPFGESSADVYDRISTFLETFYRDFDKEWFPRTVIIISHGLTIKTFLMRFFHWSVEKFDKTKTIRNCEIIRIEKKYNKYELLTELRN